MAYGGIQLVTGVEQLEPQEDGSTGDVPPGFATPAAIASLLKPAVAAASAFRRVAVSVARSLTA